jgi:hypothetical protein
MVVARMIEDPLAILIAGASGDVECAQQADRSIRYTEDIVRLFADRDNPYHDYLGNRNTQSALKSIIELIPRPDGRIPNNIGQVFSRHF